MLTIAKAMNLKENTEENLVNCYISNLDFVQHLEGQSSPNIDIIIDVQKYYKYSTTTKLQSTLLSTFPMYSMTECGGKVIGIFLEKL